MNNQRPVSAAHARFLLARGWQHKGKTAAAIAGCREALALEPGHLHAAVLLGAMMQENHRLTEAIEVYREALEHHPNEAVLHKQFVNVTLLYEGPDAVFRYYKLDRADSKRLSLEPADVLCCIVLRNELSRLPYFLEYYRKQGIAAFLAVDNGSSDGSLEYLLQQPDVYLWQSRLSFNRANFGAGWFEPILRIHGQGHWCLIVDADELFYYPECERRSIGDLCRQLDRKNKRAFSAIHLDMYSDQPIRDTLYTSGRPFQDVCPYFDREFYHRSFENAGPFHNQKAYFGGVRERIFGKAGEYYLSKVPLLKYGPECILAGGQHWTNLRPERIAGESGCLLHFKYFASFRAYVEQETARQEHYAGAMQYREYERGLRQAESLTFYDPAHSLRLENSRQLVRLGLMQDEDDAGSSAAPAFPKIEPVASGDVRPFWSVMLTVYRRTGYIEQALRSVLAQAPRPDQMQIEVLCDGPEHPAQLQLESRVRSIAGDRVVFHRSVHRAGHPEIFNLCLRRARGLWIHLLHDDDWIEPGFYETLYQGILQAPEIGAAFCRHTHMDENGQSHRLSYLERETAGVLENWLDRIGALCRLQTPSIVVRREAYERLGGYCPAARSAFDWEMWQRLTVHYPVWYEPTPLACFRESDASETARLTAAGQQIADTRGVIEIARSYLPDAEARRLSHRAGENYALGALDVARKKMEEGDLPAALANIREGLQCSRSEEVTQKLFSLLLRAPVRNSRVSPPPAAGAGPADL